MQPTNELRFVECESGYSSTGNTVNFKVIRVLQQKWSGTDTYSGGRKEEWRDVPLVKEDV